MRHFRWIRALSLAMFTVFVMTAFGVTAYAAADVNSEKYNAFNGTGLMSAVALGEENRVATQLQDGRMFLKIQAEDSGSPHIVRTLYIMSPTDDDAHIDMFNHGFQSPSSTQFGLGTADVSDAVFISASNIDFGDLLKTPAKSSANAGASPPESKPIVMIMLLSASHQSHLQFSPAATVRSG